MVLRQKEDFIITTLSVYLFLLASESKLLVDTLES